MSGLVASLLFPAVWLLTGGLLAPAYRGLRRTLLGAPPVQRLRQLQLLCLLPLATAASVCALLYWPQKLIATVSAHCHSASCAPHPPVTEPAFSGGSIAALALLFCLALALSWIRLLRQHGSQIDQLQSLASTPDPRGFECIESARPMAFTSGYFRARIFVSLGLLRQLNPRSLTAILSHERAHAAGFDNLRRALSMLLAPSLLSGPQSLLQRDLVLATELRADAMAANALGDPLWLADTLLQVQRLPRLATPQAASAFCDRDHLAERIRWLLQPPAPSYRGPSTILILALVYVGSVAIGVELGHTALEWLLPQG